MITVTSPPTRQVGSIADLDPVNNFYGSLATDYRPASSGGSANNYNNHNVSTPNSNQNQQTKLTSSGVRSVSVLSLTLYVHVTHLWFI